MQNPLERSRYFSAALIASLLLLTAASARSQTPDDSVDVLLLSTPRTSEVVVAVPANVVTATTPSLNRRRPVGNMRVRASGDSMVIDGATVVQLRLASSAPIAIASGKRRRAMRGSLTIRSRSGALQIVARMSTADYLAGVISSEARATDPREYLVALLVLQRNYVASHPRRHGTEADVCDNTHCQLFHGTAVTPSMRAAVRESQGLSLRGPDALPSYYSANCGGSTLTPSDVWGAVEPGYTSVRCSHCRNSRWYRWTRDVRATARATAALAGAPSAPFVDDHFKIRVGRALGFEVVPSNTIDRVERRGSHYRISGRGFGHRVGLCQDGARELALRGRSAREILAVYFPAVALTELRHE